MQVGELGLDQFAAIADFHQSIQYMYLHAEAVWLLYMLQAGCLAWQFMWLWTDAGML